jgi:hypothetical protein
MNNLVAGVEISTDKAAPNETWLAVGRLTSGVFEIMELRKTASHQLGAELQKLGHLAAAGMNFPFSLPASFIQFAAKRLEGKNFQSWPEVVEHLAFMKTDDLLEHLKAFKNEAKRATDEMYKALAFSPLHRGIPPMLETTIQGMRMLATLDPKSFSVLPFYDAADGSCSIIEVLPRATMWCVGMPDHGYWSPELKEPARLQQARSAVLKDLLELKETHPLSCRDYPKLSVSAHFQSTAVNTNHALDALMACYTTGIWLSAPQLFPDPFDADDENVLLEGWIYAPRKTHK